MLAVALGFALASWLNSSGKHETASYHYYESKCAICLDLAAGKPKGATKQQDGHCKPKEPDWCDLAAQYRAASAAESSRIATWLAFFAAAYGVFLLLKTLDQTEATAKAILDEQRAWLSFEILDACHHIDNTGLNLKIRIKNTGKTPAKNIEIFKRDISEIWGEHSDIYGLEQLIARPESFSGEDHLFFCLPKDSFGRTLEIPDRPVSEMLEGDRLDYYASLDIFPRKTAVAIFYDISQSDIRKHTAFVVETTNGLEISTNSHATRIT